MRSTNNHVRYQGKTVLVTGASSGIGAAFARELASRGMHLILVARSVDRLNTLAAELGERHCTQVTVLPADLSAEHAAANVYAEVARRGLHVDMLINNAGFANHGNFEAISTVRDHQQIMVNVAALVELTHLFVPAMLDAGGGAVINIASTVAFQPVPFMAVYGASKAFVTSFSAALAQEYRSRGLRVLALCPGATATGFFDVVGTDAIALGRKRSPEQVVSSGLRALERGRSVVIDGPVNTLVAVVAKRLPFGLAARLAARITLVDAVELAAPKGGHRGIAKFGSRAPVIWRC
ncbi:SDR family oxidoreductase [Candidatus Gracilibacteria bacterium]|nr:SDR family oxidoreductase [Candidatus Gracilibacteria bacterium]